MRGRAMSRSSAANLPAPHPNLSPRAGRGEIQCAAPPEKLMPARPRM